jgi:predicted TIM-barrel fold metal-dependent hydrolase
MTREEAIDCHIHIIGDERTYPLDPKRRYTPAPASAEEYWAALADTPVSRTVIVQPSFYGTDNTCLVDALQAMGDRARGVAVLDP